MNLLVLEELSDCHSVLPFCGGFCFFFFCIISLLAIHGCRSTPVCSLAVHPFFSHFVLTLLAHSFARALALLVSLHFSSVFSPQTCLSCVRIRLRLLFTLKKSLSLLCVWRSRNVSDQSSQ